MGSSRLGARHASRLSLLLSQTVLFQDVVNLWRCQNMGDGFACLGM